MHRWLLTLGFHSPHLCQLKSEWGEVVSLIYGHSGYSLIFGWGEYWWQRMIHFADASWYLRVGDVMVNSAWGNRAGWDWSDEGYRTTSLNTLVTDTVMEHSWESKGYISRFSSQCTFDSNSSEYSKSFSAPKYS